MQVSVAKAPEPGTHFHCAAPDCDEKITKTHVLMKRERHDYHLCNAQCYVKLRKKQEKAA